VTVAAVGAGRTHSAAVALNVNPPPSPATASISIQDGLPQCTGDGGCVTGTVQVQMGGVVQGNTCYITGGGYTSINFDNSGLNGVADAAGLANAIAAAFTGQGVNPSVAVSPDGTSATVSFVTTQTGTSQNFALAVYITSGLQGLNASLSNVVNSNPDPYYSTCVAGYFTGGV